jgi:hypothetical protein
MAPHTSVLWFKTLKQDANGRLKEDTHEIKCTSRVDNPFPLLRNLHGGKVGQHFRTCKEIRADTTFFVEKSLRRLKIEQNYKIMDART